MSMQALAWAYGYQDIPRDERSGRVKSSCKLVLQALANYAGPTGGDCFPSVGTISYYTGLSERAVQYALNDLVTHGTIAETKDPLVRSSTIGRPDQQPKSYDLVAFQRCEKFPANTGSQRGARSTSGVQDLKERGANSKIESPDRGCKVSGDLAPEPVIEPTPQKQPNSEPKGSDTNADASCRGGGGGEHHQDQDLGGGEDRDLFGSELILPEDNHQDRTGKTSGNGTHPGNKRAAGSGVQVKRAKRSSQLPPDQAAAVRDTVAAWVDAYRDTHAGVEPSGPRKGQAGREIRALIVAGNDPVRVLHAARAAGRAGFATVEQELARMTGPPGNGHRRMSATELPAEDYRRWVQE